MSFVCRSGHASDEPDYCSVCGTRIAGATAVVLPILGGFCPLCGEPREPASARYCDVCRYDFHEHRPGPPPVAAPRRIAAPEPAWELVITVDSSLDTDPDPAHPCPVGVPPRIVAIDRPEMLVGRDDEPRDIHPEIPLCDPGASRRHAKVLRDPDGGLALQDLASTNGSQINGRDVPAGTRPRLFEGDAVTLGRWTRLTLRARQ